MMAFLKTGGCTPAKEDGARLGQTDAGTPSSSSPPSAASLAKKRKSLALEPRGSKRASRSPPPKNALTRFFMSATAAPRDERGADRAGERARTAIPELGAIREVALTENVTQEAAKAAWGQLQSRMANSIPLCRHRERCKVRQVKNKESPNLGRTFYCCPRQMGEMSNPESDCGFFEWATGVGRRR